MTDFTTSESQYQAYASSQRHPDDPARYLYPVRGTGRSVAPPAPAPAEGKGMPPSWAPPIVRRLDRPAVRRVLDSDLPVRSGLILFVCSYRDAGLLFVRATCEGCGREMKISRSVWTRPIRPKACSVCARKPGLRGHTAASVEQRRDALIARLRGSL
jgi:hypothetical protein